MLLRRGRFDRAAKAAAEAVALYEPIHATGDARVTTGLAFVHRVLAITEARAKRFRPAFEHAERALQLNEPALLDSCVVLQLALNVALKNTASYRGAQPPHPYEAPARRIERLAGVSKRR